jgi:hypothetical protein
MRRRVMSAEVFGLRLFAFMSDAGLVLFVACGDKVASF